MARRGRPRQERDLEKARDEIKELRAWLSEELRQCPGNLITPSARLARFAASLFLTLARGTQRQKERCKPLLQKLRRWARAEGFDDKPFPGGGPFLDAFIQKFAPGWDWRKDIDKNGELGAQNDQIAAENAVIYRADRAKKERYVTPDNPDLDSLHALKRVMVNDPTTWPTLRDLKLATALPERRLEKIVAALSPNKNEIVRIALRQRFRKGGAFPKRFAPRLVYGVLQEFLNVLSSDSSRNNAKREPAKQAALAVKRSLAARMAAFR